MSVVSPQEDIFITASARSLGSNVGLRGQSIRKLNWRYKLRPFPYCCETKTQDGERNLSCCHLTRSSNKKVIFIPSFKGLSFKSEIYSHKTRSFQHLIINHLNCSTTELPLPFAIYSENSSALNCTVTVVVTGDN